MIKKRLAIVIPAYKSIFLDQTLDSLAKQTCRDFTVYIGDDDSPYQLRNIVDKYMGKLDIVYHHFQENVGGRNLIEQWHRCVKLIRDEEFFCLFSDDDLMEPNNVKYFYETLHSGNDGYDVYHFNIDIIDSEGKLLKECNKYPSLLSSLQFFYMIYTGQIDARIPEFIFRTKHFWNQGGYVDFDLGYTSDNATVMVCAERQGIYSVPEAKVLWRESGINLSSDKDIVLTQRRTRALIHFLNWTDTYFARLEQVCPFTLKRKVKLVTRYLKKMYPTVGLEELCHELKLFHALSDNYVLYLFFKMRLIWAIIKENNNL